MTYQLNKVILSEAMFMTITLSRTEADLLPWVQRVENLIHNWDAIGISEPEALAQLKLTFKAYLPT